MEVAIVWWLMASDYANGSVVFPVPFSTEHYCQVARESMPSMGETYCVPQPESDVFRWTASTNGQRGSLYAKE